jgi:hypothetical protein
VRPGSWPRESPESRLLAAGFTRRLEFWCPPGEERALSLNDAALDAGEIQPPHLDWPGVHPDAVVVRAEIRAALKAEAGRKAQEPKP